MNKKNILLVAILCAAVAVIHTSDQFNELDVNEMKKPKVTAKVDPFLSDQNDFRLSIRPKIADEKYNALEQAKKFLKKKGYMIAGIIINSLLTDIGVLDFDLRLKSDANKLLQILQIFPLDEQNKILKRLKEELELDALAENERTRLSSGFTMRGM